MPPLSGLAFAGNLAEHVFVEQFFQFGEGIHPVVQAVQQHEACTRPKPRPITPAMISAFVCTGFVRERVAGRLINGDAFRADVLVHIQRFHRGEQLIVKRLDAVGLGLEPFVLGALAAQIPDFPGRAVWSGLQVRDLQRQRAFFRLQLFHALIAGKYPAPGPAFQFPRSSATIFGCLGLRYSPKRSWSACNSRICCLMARYSMPMVRARTDRTGLQAGVDQNAVAAA